jgi:1,6-anhydro-N-acetylmuramate kinase
MHVRVRLDGAEPRRWQIALLERIAAMAGIRTVGVDAAPVPNGWPDTVADRLGAPAADRPRSMAAAGRQGRSDDRPVRRLTRRAQHLASGL